MNDNGNNYGYDWLKSATEDQKLQNEYEEIREASKTGQVNAMLDSMSSSPHIGPVIEPPMERKSMSEIEKIPSGPMIDKTRGESLLDSLRGKDDVKIVMPSESVEIKKKNIDNNKLSQVVAKTIAKLLLVATLAASGAVFTADITLHPENYSTRYDGYVGAPTIPEFVGRIDDNFEEIKDTIAKGR